MPAASSPPRRRVSLWLMTAMLVTSAWMSGAGQAQAPVRDFQVVVHSGNPAAILDRRFLSQAFLRKTGQWDSGEPIRPVDLPADSETRRRFSEVVHGRSVAAVKSYWQQVIFSGRGVPPPELESDEEVIRHVGRAPGSVGYVSGAADLRGVRAVAVR
jgi:ABC-type phosphate transport system substrate-binding protein